MPMTGMGDFVILSPLHRHWTFTGYFPFESRKESRFRDLAGSKAVESTGRFGLRRFDSPRVCYLLRRSFKRNEYYNSWLPHGRGSVVAGFVQFCSSCSSCQNPGNLSLGSIQKNWCHAAPGRIDKDQRGQGRPDVIVNAISFPIRHLRYF